MVLDHPMVFREGTRVLLLKGRHKDGLVEERSIARVTHSILQFTRALDELCVIRREGERIYASAGPRCIDKATREFKRRQLDADYEPDRAAFYRHLEDRWVSSLMVPGSQQEKIWLFDCDVQGQGDLVMDELTQFYDRPMAPYRYTSKSGEHILVQAFNMAGMSQEATTLVQANSLMLWVY